MPRSSPYAVAVALLLVAVGSERAGPHFDSEVEERPLLIREREVWRYSRHFSGQFSGQSSDQSPDQSPGQSPDQSPGWFPGPNFKPPASRPLHEVWAELFRHPSFLHSMFSHLCGGSTGRIVGGPFTVECAAANVGSYQSHPQPAVAPGRGDMDMVSRAVSRGVTELTLRLDRALGGLTPTGGSLPGSRPDNVVFSPLSVAVALALLLLGSGGRTHQELADVLGLTGLNLRAEDTAVHQHFGQQLQQLQQLQRASNASTKTLSAQGVFVQNNLPLRQRFLQVARQAYLSDVVTLDFAREPEQAQQAVNSWVAEKTDGRITGMMPEPPPRNTRLVLATALYFNGQWEHPFPNMLTNRRRFFVTGQEDGETLEIDMMANTAELPYVNNSVLGCQVLGLPYKGGQVVMYLVLPHQRGVAALKDLEGKLTVDALDELVASAETRGLIALVPRMRLEFGASLREPLQELGVFTLFDPLRANLSQLASGPEMRLNDVGGESTAPAFAPLYVDQVLHKVEVEVTETGTVATAATVASIARDGSLPVFRADRPFLFFIRHQPTGLMLFWGSVIRPTPA